MGQLDRELPHFLVKAWHSHEIQLANLLRYDTRHSIVPTVDWRAIAMIQTSLRWPVAALASIISTAAFAQVPITPFRQLSTGSAVTMSTSDFNPQIIEPTEFTARTSSENESPIIIPNGVGNSLKAGSVTSKQQGKLQKNFPGIGFTGWIPPDPEIAVGPNFIVSTVNSDIAFFNKSTGAKTFQQPMSAGGFFSGIGVTSSFTFDPKCFFDKISNRFFVIICEEDDATQTSKMLLAVSDDADPAGTWYKYRIESKANDGSGEHWLDYPGFGYNKDAIVFTGNMFPFAGGGVFTQVVVIPKAPLLTGGAATASYLQDGTMFTVQPSRVPEASQANIYGVSAQSTTSIRIVALTNLLSTPQLFKKDVAVPAWVRPSAVPVNGGRFLDGLDGRLYNCHFRGGRLVTAHSTKNGDGRMKARWYEFNVNTWPASGSPTLKQSGDILLSGTNTHMPAINTNSAGDISVIYSRNDSGTNPTTCESSRFATDALGSMGAPVVIANSAGLYGGAGTNRWGDYFGCEIDPNDGLTFWGIGMVAAAGGAWVTHIDKWTVSSGTTGTLVDPTAVAVTQGSNTSGDISSLLTSDNNRYTIQSVLIDKSGNPTAVGSDATAQAAAAQIDFDLDLSGGPATDVKVVVEASVNKTGPAGMLFAYNWSTGKFDSIAAFALSTSDKASTLTLPKATLSNYVDPSGAVRLLVRGINSVKGGRPGTIPPQFSFNIDRVGLAPTFGP
jgi:hypothetical protein